MQKGEIEILMLRHALYASAYRKQQVNLTSTEHQPFIYAWKLPTSLNKIPSSILPCATPICRQTQAVPILHVQN